MSTIIHSNSCRALLQGGLATLAIGFLVATAQAGENATDHSIAVRYDDLNLSSQAGVERLYDRIHGAAKRVCGEETAPRPLERSFASKKCKSEAIAAAIKAVDNRTLTALYDKKVAKGSAESEVRS